MKSRRIASGAGVVLHSLIVPVFVLLFIIYYKPYDTYNFLNMSNVSFTFNVTMMFCIVFLSVSVTRVWLYILSKFKTLTKPLYLIWCVGEVIVASAFCSLYLVLVSDAPLSFFEVSGFTFARLLSTALYPYAFLWLGFELYAKSNDAVPSTDENSLIRFHDEYKKLRLVIAPEAVAYIRSEDNYVNIFYLDQGLVKKFMLRSSMRALEDLLSKHGLVRCHRSYFVNPAFIKIVHRDAAGLIVADLKLEGQESIPISRKYQDAITRLL